ncbi:hypothetical protein AYO41_04565 [Verrucomicrobia bacterium SCGC AG-212-E04]|nr:hypothetical protein AYO41_04565 [Verrucomicrobia bacterium SCGC AG-212-E04]
MPRLWILAYFAIAAVAQSATLEGEVTLKYDESAFGKSAYVKQFGDIVKATTNWRVGEQFAKETIFAGITAKNTGTKPMFFQYYVAFFDKDMKMVGATGQASFGEEGLKPGETTSLTSCLVHLPKGRYKDIVSFQAVLYETDQPLKKK